MPNGESKNWIRFCASIDGYRARYGIWPEKVLVPGYFAEELTRVLSKKDQKRLASKISLIGDGSLFVATDQAENNYDYSREGFSEKRPDVSAVDWLGITPDYYD